MTVEFPELVQPFRFTLERLTPKETIRRYGPWGDNKEHDFRTRGPAPETLPQWHAIIAPHESCEHGHIEEYMSFRGHGHTAAEAITEAVNQLQAMTAFSNKVTVKMP
jgi:hypothetical protein